ncbi:HEAT repeat domain-containing protein [Hymenobacter arizonensis]|uniref:Putative zinc-finger n=1 Tax=Hymenobacter arizonensis TaxID=1227077 RepID=A0A1I6BJD1_HYMAR|nr:HEAT repeat domain-containing protein [Hymenobacter arizonensis]SFQ80897.1 Putative zinc-finger [Hymenobacter arizonensis]
MNSIPASADCLDVADLLVDYTEGTLSPEQTSRVTAHMAHCLRCQQHVAHTCELADIMAAIRIVPPPAALDAALLAALAQETDQLKQPAGAGSEAIVVPLNPTSVHPTSSGWWLRIAASLLLLAAGMVLGNHWRPLSSATVALSTPDAQAAPRFQALVGNLTAPTLSASQRLLLVSELAAEAQTSGDPVVQALINTLNFDPNPNVRLAAGKGLYRLRADPRVAEAFVQSLTIQTDPYVQILLIELLVEMREQRAKPELERLSRRPDALPVVRQEAKAGLGQLI